MKAIVITFRRVQKAISKWYWSAITSSANVLTRHRSIYGVLSEELADGVHALALHTYTLKEWEGLQDTVPASPPCRGAGTLA